MRKRTSSKRRSCPFRFDYLLDRLGALSRSYSLAYVQIIFCSVVVYVICEHELLIKMVVHIRNHLKGALLESHSPKSCHVDSIMNLGIELHANMDAILSVNETHRFKFAGSET